MLLRVKALLVGAGLIAAVRMISAGPGDVPSLEAAQRAFYNGQYATAVAIAAAIEGSPVNELATLELQSSALHMQLRRLIGRAADKDLVLRQCATCPTLLSEFARVTALGQAASRARLKNGANVEALFFLGKFDMNYIWLNLDTLGRRTGWSEYREGRRSLEAALRLDPSHIRARVARSWIDYIVDTKVTWGFRWVLGGGNRRRALATSREVAAADASYFEHVEAVFALWEMQVRERNFPDAIVTARQLAEQFPDNEDVKKFLADQATNSKE